jgi:bla regulator protein blaR1
MSVLPFTAMSYPSWAATGAPIANHLWQSTLFAATAGLLTLLLRKNHTSARYSLWFLASMKFLLPFSLFVYIGNHLAWSRIPASAQPGLLFMMEEVGRPFATAPANHAAGHLGDTALALAARALPFLLLAVWFAGFEAMVCFWWSRWRRMTAVRRSSVAEKSGREYETLRRLERGAGISGHVGLAISKSALEPGILGIFRPVLLLPSGISERLTDEQLEAVMVHELCHVRRRDNLAAALHMLVEALFWFHPLVWWLGARLVDERERACDEEVLGLGSDPQTYAESILKICEFYMESPLLCASGVTGSNLKKRIEVIMQNRAPRNLDFARKLLLSSAGFVAAAIPLALGLLHPAHALGQSQSQDAVVASAAFESVYLQPNTTGEPMPPFIVYGRPMKAVQFEGEGFLATNFSLRDLIKLAYKVQSEQVTGGPNWLDSEKYDVNAKLSSAELEKRKLLSQEERAEEMRTQIQALLGDRFKLAIHHETRPLPVYVIVAAEKGPQLLAAKPGDTYADGLKDRSGRALGPGALLFPESNKLVAQAIAIKTLTGWLGGQDLGRMVVDKTGIPGNFDVTLQLPPKSTNYWSGSVLSAALEQQLGLKLEEQESSVEVLVIDRAEKPSQIESRVDAVVGAPR